MSDRYPLDAMPRTITGKKVKQLRAQGQIPAVVYGPKREPLHISIEWPKLRPVLMEAGGTHIIDLKIEGTSIPTLVREVHRHHTMKDRVIHIDFYAVNLLETVVASVPVSVINDRKAAEAISGRVIQDISMLEIEALPTSIPEEIVVDASVITEIGQSIHAYDLTPIEGVTFLLDDEIAIVRSDYRPEAPASDDSEDETASGSEPELIRRKDDEDFDD